MSLRELQRRLDDLSGVKHTTLIDDGTTLKVVWEGRPNDYSRELRELQGEYPNIEHTPTPSGEPESTSDGMPIHYYTE